MDLANYTVLIFGVSSGIGYTLANILHEYGATVIGTYKEHKIEELYDTYQCDLTKEEEIKEIFSKTIKKHEKIDVVINCAALDINNDLYLKTKEEFMKVLEVNLVGTFLVCKYASLNMKKGIIINMSSTDASDTYNPLSMDYAASKAGIENLAKNLAQRLPNLKVCALAPNWVDTESVLKMNPEYLEKELQRVGQDKLLKKEAVALKILEIMIDDDIRSGEIIRMSGKNE